MYFPALQLVQELTACVEYVPLVQIEQAEASAPTALLDKYFPAVQEAQDGEPSAEY